MNHFDLMQGRIDNLERKLATAQKHRDHYAGLYADRCGQLLEREAKLAVAQKYADTAILILRDLMKTTPYRLRDVQESAGRFLYSISFK